MEEKGGNNKASKYIESHHILLIFMIVLNFAVLVLCLVFLGMQLVHREENLTLMELENEAGEYIQEIKPLYFEVLGSSNYESTNSTRNSGTNLFEGTVVEKAEYQVIESGAELTNILSSVGNASINGQDFSAISVDESFFQTGSIIAVAFEDQGLESFQVGKLTRDENGDVTVVGSYSSNSDVEKVYGTVVLLKVQNVQPKTLTIDISEK